MLIQQAPQKVVAFSWMEDSYLEELAAANLKIMFIKRINGENG